MTAAALLSSMLGPDVTFALRRTGAVPESALLPVEARAVSRAVERRRLEVAAGRDAAREAMASLGVPPVAIGRSASGAPIWPAGIVGSITHTAELCAAAVTSRERRTSIGIDAEPEEPIERELFRVLATRDELRELAWLAPADAGVEARALFCAKEAAYKCQFPLTRLLLELTDLEIRWIEAHGQKARRFDATFRRDVAPFRCGDRIPGLLGRAEGHLWAVAALTPTGNPDRARP